MHSEITCFSRPQYPCGTLLNLKYMHFLHSWEEDTNAQFRMWNEDTSHQPASWICRGILTSPWRTASCPRVQKAPSNLINLKHSFKLADIWELSLPFVYLDTHHTPKCFFERISQFWETAQGYEEVNQVKETEEERREMKGRKKKWSPNTES